MKYERLKGFRDLYPEDMEPKDQFFENAKRTARLFGYSMIDYPSLETIELYLDKSGEELLGQTFSFMDKGGRNVTMLPEATPSVMRMLTARKDLPRPVRWFGIPKIWRYEEPQSGRLREHFQFNADLFGPDNAEADSEIINLASQILDSCGLGGKYSIKMNNRLIMDGLLDLLQISDKERALSIIDRFHKVDPETFRALFMDIAQSADAVNSIQDLVQNKGPAQVIKDGMEENFTLTEGMRSSFRRLELTESLVSSYSSGKIEMDLSVVRGLSYYTGTVFEFSDSEGNFRSILGGGRYNNLARKFSGTDIPAVGFGMGDVVIELMMRKYGVWSQSSSNIQAYMISTSEAGSRMSMEVSRMLREIGIKTLVDLSGRSITNQIRSASSSGAEFAFIFGDREKDSGTVSVKNLRSGEQLNFGLDKIMDFIRTQYPGNDRNVHS